MRSIKKILLIFVIVCFVLPSFLVTAASNDSKSVEDGAAGEGEISSKDEVVYAKLNATGDRQELYVVNILEVERDGEIVDYGTYSSLKNLTDVSPLEQKDNTVLFSAPEGKFYYQGNMNDEALPWDISVTYFLDGKEIAPDVLAGKDGHVQMKIVTSKNEQVDPVFFNNYLLQISLALNLENYRNIEAPDGILANAGRNKQITFTVLPEKEGELIVEADVVDFEFDGINISAIPSSMPIDAPDIDNELGDMENLTNAIKEMNSGVAELKNGVTEFNNGVKDFRDGSKDYKTGIAAFYGSSSDLINSSNNIKQGLEEFNKRLESAEEPDLGSLKELEAGLVGMATGLRETSKQLITIKEDYTIAYGKLNKAMEAIPNSDIAEEELQKLRKSDANQEVIEQLINNYTAARDAKSMYSDVKTDFDRVVGALQQTSGSLTGMATKLEEIVGGLSPDEDASNAASSFSKLQNGIRLLASNYKLFHSGLKEYVEGVGQFSSSYSELHNGIEGIADGSVELTNGVSELHDGTAELYESTSDLPEQMKQEVDKMMEDYDKSDFEAISFVSPKNEKINSVQFVLKTESIQIDEPEETAKPVEEEKGFWARLLALFK